MASVAQAAPVTYTDNSAPSQYGAIGIDEGAQDGFYQPFDADTAYPGVSYLGFGHGNRTHHLLHYDLSVLSATANPNARFVVSDASLSFSEGDSLDYDGLASMHAILVDWVSGAVAATWNNLELAGTGSAGHDANELAQYNKPESSNSYLFAGSSSFDALVEEWLNTPDSNLGLLIRATAGSPSSYDGVSGWQLQFDYETVAISAPATWLLLVLGAGMTRRRLEGASEKDMT